MLRRHRLGIVCLLACLGTACHDERSNGSKPGSHDGGAAGSGGAPENPMCGNRIVEEGEECDDGVASGACDADCTEVACGDGTVNPDAGELCDDAVHDLCDACKAKPFDLDSGGWTGLWPDVAVTSEQEFLVVYKRGNVRDVIARTFDANGTATSPDILLHPAETVGPVSVAASPLGGALVAWQYMGPSFPISRYRMLDASLEPLAGTEPLSGRDPHVAAGADGRYCIAGFDKDVPIDVLCVDAQGQQVGSSTFPATWGAEYYESHDIIATGDGYVFTYVPDNVTHELVAYPLDASGLDAGEPFATTDFVDPYWSWVPKWGGNPGQAGFVTLAGLRTGLGSPGEPLDLELFYRVYSGPGQPLGEPVPVPSTPDATVHEGMVLLHHSGRFAVVWTGNFVYEPTTNTPLDCAIKARRFGPDGTPLGNDVTLYDPEGPGCARGIRGALNTAGDALLTWMFAINGETMAVKQALLLPSLFSTTAE